MNLKDATAADLAHLRLRTIEFKDDPLWDALRAHVARDLTRILKDLADPSLAGERLKFAQGELAQANRDIMLVDEFLKALSSEQQRRQRMEERS